MAWLVLVILLHADAISRNFSCLALFFNPLYLMPRGRKNHLNIAILLLPMAGIKPGSVLSIAPWWLSFLHNWNFVLTSILGDILTPEAGKLRTWRRRDTRCVVARSRLSPRIDFWGPGPKAGSRGTGARARSTCTRCASRPHTRSRSTCSLSFRRTSACRRPMPTPTSTSNRRPATAEWAAASGASSSTWSSSCWETSFCRNHSESFTTRGGEIDLGLGRRRRRRRRCLLIRLWSRFDKIRTAEFN